MKDLENLSLKDLDVVLIESLEKFRDGQISRKEANSISKLAGRRIKAIVKEMEDRKKNNLEISTKTMPNVINNK